MLFLVLLLVSLGEAIPIACTAVDCKLILANPTTNTRAIDGQVS